MNLTFTNFNIMPLSAGELTLADNVSPQDLNEHYDVIDIQHQKILEENKAIKHLYELATKENADLQKALNENMQGDVQFTEGFEEALEAATKENVLLKMEITHLKYQKHEITKTAEENVKSLQERIVEQQKVIELQNTKIEKFTINDDIVLKFLDKEIELWRSHVAYESGGENYLTAHYTKFLNERLEIRAKLLGK
jgi:PBP1b-binding outer membrane lipoprotein LpoB